jgi:hypothetical protein
MARDEGVNTSAEPVTSLVRCLQLCLGGAPVRLCAIIIQGKICISAWWLFNCLCDGNELPDSHPHEASSFSQDLLRCLTRVRRYIGSHTSSIVQMIGASMPVGPTEPGPMVGRRRLPS